MPPGGAASALSMTSTRIRNGGPGSQLIERTGHHLDVSDRPHPGLAAIPAAPSERTTSAQPVLADVDGGEVGPGARGARSLQPATAGLPGRRVPARDPQSGGHPDRGTRAGRAYRGHCRADVVGLHRLRPIPAACVQVDGLGPGGDGRRRVAGQLGGRDRDRGILRLAAFPVQAGFERDPGVRAVHRPARAARRCSAGRSHAWSRYRSTYVPPAPVYSSRTVAPGRAQLDAHVDGVTGRDVQADPLPLPAAAPSATTGRAEWPANRPGRRARLDLGRRGRGAGAEGQPGRGQPGRAGRGVPDRPAHPPGAERVEEAVLGRGGRGRDEVRGDASASVESPTMDCGVVSPIMLASPTMLSIDGVAPCWSNRQRCCPPGSDWRRRRCWHHR